MPLHTNHEPARVSSTASSLAGEGQVCPPLAKLSPAFSFHIAKERYGAIFPAHCSSLASRAASGLIKNLNLFLAGQLRRKARTATNSDGRPATRSFDCRHTPSPAAWRAVFSYANPSQAHAAPAIHGASL